jgi:UDP-N-acetylmuramyl tripeptide synthase
MDNEKYTTILSLKGIYNAYNAAGALALVRSIIKCRSIDNPDAARRPVPTAPATRLNHIDQAARLNQQDKPAGNPRDKRLIGALSRIKGAFGRGETVMVGDTEVELLLVKNPGGFRLSLESFDPIEHAIMIAINDEYADGRDMSWLYDVLFDKLRNQGVYMVSGVRAWDMALRLWYDEVEFDDVDPDLGRALNSFLDDDPELPHRIYCTYTAMLELRRLLASKTNVEKVM